MREFFGGLLFLVAVTIVRGAGRIILTKIFQFWRGPGSRHTTFPQKIAIQLMRLRDYRLSPLETVGWAISSAFSVAAISVLPLDGAVPKEGVAVTHMFVVFVSLALVTDSWVRKKTQSSRNAWLIGERLALTSATLLVLLLTQYSMANALGPGGWEKLFSTPWLGLKSIPHLFAFFVLALMMGLVLGVSARNARWLDSGGLPMRALEVGFSAALIIMFWRNGLDASPVFALLLVAEVAGMLLLFDLVDAASPTLRTDISEYVFFKYIFPTGLLVWLGVWASGG